MVIEHVSTELMIVDLLTKGMPLMKFSVNGSWFHVMTIIIFYFNKTFIQFFSFCCTHICLF